MLFRNGERVLPFDLNPFEELHDLRMLLETTAAHRLCEYDLRALPPVLDELAATWLVSLEPRSNDTLLIAQWDEAFHCMLVAAAGNAKMARVHRDVTERIRVICRFDFPKQPRMDATYREYGEILKAIQRKRGDQAALLLRAHIQTSQTEVRKIMLHQVHLARQMGGAAG